LPNVVQRGPTHSVVAQGHYYKLRNYHPKISTEIHSAAKKRTERKEVEREANQRVFEPVTIILGEGVLFDLKPVSFLQYSRHDDAGRTS
jgi:hypothetical protein